MQSQSAFKFARLGTPLLAAIGGTLISCSACNDQQPAAETMQKLGYLSLSSTNVLTTNFWLREGYSPTLALSIRPETYSFTEVISLDRTLAKLRIATDLSETNALASFYEGTVLLHGNMAACRRWPSNWGASICGIEPLPYDWPQTNAGVTAVYRYGRDTFPVRSGQLLGNHHYTIKIRVLEPVPITNQGCFWIYLTRPQ